MTDIDLKKQIRPLYLSLKAYLAQAPQKQESGIKGTHPAEVVNGMIEQLVTLDEDEEYKKFKTEIVNGHFGKYVAPEQYRPNLNALINRLYGKYFFEEENEPFSSTPTTVMQQNSTQTVQVSMLLNIQEKILDKLHDEDVTDNERGFLNKLKNAISTATSATQLISLILNLANTHGITVERLGQLFS